MERLTRQRDIVTRVRPRPIQICLADGGPHRDATDDSVKMRKALGSKRQYLDDIPGQSATTRLHVLESSARVVRADDALLEHPLDQPDRAVDLD